MIHRLSCLLVLLASVSSCDRPVDGCIGIVREHLVLRVESAATTQPVDNPSFAHVGDGGLVALTASCVDIDGGPCAAYRLDLPWAGSGLVAYSVTVTAAGFEPASISVELVTSTGCGQLPDVARTVQLTPVP